MAERGSESPLEGGRVLKVTEEGFVDEYSQAQKKMRASSLKYFKKREI